MKKLEDKIALLKRASDAYYNSEEPIMSDAEFDALQDEVGFVEIGFPVLKSPIKHLIPMLSLHKASAIQDLDKFLNKAQLDDDFTVQTKIDGSSISLVYDGGVLISAATRGKGTVGMNITELVKDIPSVPATIDDKDKCVVRGEVVLPKEAFNRIGGTNPRNVGNGILTRESGENQRNLLVFYPFDVCKIDGAKMNQIQKMEWIKSVKTWVPPITLEASNKHAVYTALDSIKEMRAGLSYDIDGAVIKMVSVDSDELGISDNRPNNQIAWKWPMEGKTTVVTDVVLTVGHTGYR